MAKTRVCQTGGVLAVFFFREQSQSLRFTGVFKAHESYLVRMSSDSPVPCSSGIDFSEKQSRRVLPGGLCPLVTLKAGAPAVLPPPLPLAYLIWFPPSLWLHYKLALLVKLEASAGCTAAFVRWLHYRPVLLLYCRLCFRWFIYMDIDMRVEICIDMYIDRNMGIYI